MRFHPACREFSKRSWVAVLLMRFVVCDHRRKASRSRCCRSPYEILFGLSDRKAAEILVLPFSLWDSNIEKSVITDRWWGKVAVLLMRFTERVRGVKKWLYICVAVLLMRFRAERNRRGESIRFRVAVLLMRFTVKLWHCQSQNIYISCRSPYEILKVYPDDCGFVPERCRSPYEIQKKAQESEVGKWSQLPFSLWDSYTILELWMERFEVAVLLMRFSSNVRNIMSRVYMLPFSLWDSPTWFFFEGNAYPVVAVLLMRFREE